MCARSREVRVELGGHGLADEGLPHTAMPRRYSRDSRAVSARGPRRVPRRWQGTHVFSTYVYMYRLRSTKMEWRTPRSYPLTDI